MQIVNSLALLITLFWQSVRQLMFGWWHTIYFGAIMAVLVLAPSSYQGATRTIMARHIYLDTFPVLGWFTLLCALLTLIITRIVIVTALSYGLSQYALEMVIRVLVLELIPLTAALFVALRCTLPNALFLLKMQSNKIWQFTHGFDSEAERNAILPRVVSGVFAALTLAALSSVVSLIVVYLAMYGFTTSGFQAYTRMFGQVFQPAVVVIFMLKTFFFGVAVTLIPIASALYDRRQNAAITSPELRGLVRLFSVILAIEIVSLMGNYY